MNKLTELYLEDWARNFPFEYREENRIFYLKALKGCDIVKIEDVYYPKYLEDGTTDKYGNTIYYRKYHMSDGRAITYRPFRWHVKLEPLKKNPLTLEDVE